MTEAGGVPSPREAALQALILDPDLERLEDMLAEFNLFAVLGVQRSEPHHSALIAWLLNPRGTHGLGDYFLRRFLMEVTQEAGLQGVPVPTPIDVNGWALGNVRVRTEWDAGAKHGRVDIMVVGDSDRFVCFIENKIDSEEHSDQLTKYFEAVDSDFKGYAVIPVFLTRDGKLPEEPKDRERYVALSYKVIVRLLDRVLETRGSTVSTGAFTFLSQYRLTLGRHVVSTGDNIDELAYSVYANHRRAMDQILRAKDLPGGLERHRLEAAVARAAPDLQPDTHTPRNICRYFSPALEEITDLRGDTAWTPSGRKLLFEVWHIPKKRIVGMSATLGPADVDTRKRILSMAKSKGSPFRKFQLNAAQKAQHTHIYQKMVIPRGYDPFNIDEAQAILEQGIAEFYEKDYLTLVNAIRAEFGLGEASLAQPPR